MVYVSLTSGSQIAQVEDLGRGTSDGQELPMSINADRPVWTIARWTCAALIAASTFVYILAHLAPASAAVAG
jgi:hypothetical protein